MKVNAKVKYALQTMVDIALNQKNHGVLQKEISHRQEISNKYLDQIVAGLKAAGLIKNIGGRKSGYVLTKPVSQVTLYEIFAAFEGDMNIKKRRRSATIQNTNAIKAAGEYWDQLNEVIAEYLKKSTLDVICDKQTRYNNVSDENMYFI